MRKKRNIVLFLLVLVLFLSACSSSVADESTIKADIEAGRNSVLSSTETIDKVDITERQTDKDRKVDMVYCTLESNDGEVAYIKYAVLYYRLSDNDGWVLNECKPDQEENWTYMPLLGVTEESIIDSLIGRTITIDGEGWQITQDNITSILVEGQETNLKEKTDTVTVSLTLDAEVAQASGQIVIEYMFTTIGTAGWTIDTILGGENFIVTLKPEVVLDVTDEDLIAEIAKEEIAFGETETGALVNYASQQTVTIKESEITDFVIESQSSALKGSQQTFNCTAMLAKPNVVFKLDVMVQYYYDGNGWAVQLIDIMPQVVSLNIQGEWNGTYNGTPYSGEAKLTITNFDEGGLITAVYSYYPSTVMRYSYPGSYNVSGTIDMTTLFMDLTAGDWVDEPESSLTITKQDIKAYLIIEDATIQGLAQEGYPFTVQQEE